MTMVAVTLGRFPGFEVSAASLKKDPTGLLRNMLCEEEQEGKRLLTVEETQLQRQLGAKWSAAAAAMVAAHYSYEGASTKVISCPGGTTWIGDLVDVADFFGLETLDPGKIFVSGSLGERASAKLFLRRRELQKKALAQIEDVLMRKPSMSVGFVSIACRDDKEASSAAQALRLSRSDVASDFEIFGAKDGEYMLTFGSHEDHYEWTNVLEEQEAFCEMLRRRGLASEWSSVDVTVLPTSGYLPLVTYADQPVLVVKVPRSGTKRPKPRFQKPEIYQKWLSDLSPLAKTLVVTLSILFALSVPIFALCYALFGIYLDDERLQL